MPERAGSQGPKEAVPHPGLRLIERVPRDDVAIRQARPGWIRSWLEEDDPEEPRRPGYGDVIEGGAAVAALLGMVAIGLSPWLAIPLSVMTYIALTLLLPTREPRDETAGGTDADQPAVEARVADSDPIQHSEGALIGASTVAAHYKLTRREQEILPLLAQRLTDREIAEQLSISHRTAMNHTANILGKLGLASRRDVAAFVAQHGLLPHSTPPHDIE
jgi:DNA-binding CsgD family transcriptional regulator